jgi:hypothetical protein
MTNWRGVTLDSRSAAMMDEVVRLCPGVPITPSQGSWSGADASAGTHSGAGAIDIQAESLHQSQRDQIVLAMRRVGWAAWVRSPDQSDWPWHIHGVSMGEPGLSPQAYDQTRDYLAGRNGLASNAPDDGPRDFHYVGIEWEEYRDGAKDDGKDTAHDDEEDDMLMVESPGRGVALVGPGYYHSLNPEERDVMLGSGIRLVKHNDRGFDVARAVCTGGTQDLD